MQGKSKLMYPKTNIHMRLIALFFRHKKVMGEALLLMGLLTAIWRIDNWIVSVICGLSAGVLFYRLAERMSQDRIRKA